ncbi:Zn-dependent metalloprotease [Nocardioides aromaticivorans]|uniref:Zn-dependent metalloprotease n=1 Tax=Nocardioides aromaticivorans TaxID=200618 RepID=A0A7Z0CNM7_9ACTN|nr:M4 family metallopeptidase [Nocardioides aromaticivorans]NYI47564.1 Zn-dependent metalloprotease [Nocardioides aromaticivorans]
MRRVLALACAAFVSSAVLGAVPAPLAVAGPDDGEAVLRADADGPLRIRREGGVATFVGTPAGTEIDNPAVGRGTSVSAAARAHLARYGAAIGADRAGTRLVEHGRSAAAAGTSVVRYQQEVDGLPVLGGDVVVTLDKDHDLASLDANLSDAASVGSATVTEDAARTTALGSVGRSRVKGATAEDLGRWVLDPATLPVPAITGARSAWRFEVRAGDGVRRMVLVDDRSGVVLLDVDLIQHADRVVCDRANLNPVDDPPVCTAAYARTEGSGASTVADVNLAFANAGRVSTFYATFGTPDMQDLTALIGHEAADGKKLRSTVRVCITGIPCPYDNAYWNGQAMFYGKDYPRADDIVGHEMTHGVIERIAGLIYFDQSGAINESLADIIGEIIDHQTLAAGESPSEFLLGEDLPDQPPFRSAADPTAYYQPDRMTSTRWYSGEGDSGGVHTNSGVGNKAFYLISQGGTFNGQTITGIDAGDQGLAKSARLWTQVIETIPAFAEYDDLATVLEQSCADLQGTVLTAADCTAVHQAVLATEMTTRPTNEPVRDAARTCPGTTVKRVLLAPASETEQAAFTAAAGWTRTPDATVVPNAFSGDTAWFAEDGATNNESLVAHLPIRADDWIDLPAGQPAYLAFRHWHAFEYWADPEKEYYDGGTVELVRDGATTANLESRAWAAYAPKRPLAYNLLPSGRTAFAGTSKGWTGSRVDLSEFAGESVKPQFTMHYDPYWGAPGWYLDDIEVYTCDIPTGTPELVGTPALTSGTPRVGRKLTISGVAWSEAGTETTYEWRRGGVPISGAVNASYTPVYADLGKVLSVVVTGTANGLRSLAHTRTTSAVQRGVITAPSKVVASGTPYVGRRLTALRGTWSPSGITFRYQWLRDGRAISGATASTYVIRRTDKGHRIAVRITGSRTGYTSVARTSASRSVTR